MAWCGPAVMDCVDELYELASGFAPVELGCAARPAPPPQQPQPQQAQAPLQALPQLEQALPEQGEYLARVQVDVYVCEALAQLAHAQAELEAGRKVDATQGRARGKVARRDPSAAEEAPPDRHVGGHDVLWPSAQWWQSALSLRAQDPAGLMSLYFDRVACGLHVEDGRFAFILATPWNRVCFARLMARRLSHVNGARVMAQGDYLQLLRLLCRDLSSDFVRLVWSLLSPSGAGAVVGVRAGSVSPAPGLLPFPQLVLATTCWLVVGECLEDVAERLCCAPGGAAHSSQSWWEQSAVGVQEAFEASAASRPTLARPPRWLVERAVRDTRNATLRSFFRAIVTAEDWSPLE